jgi:FkbM family methyltransferase
MNALATTIRQLKLKFIERKISHAIQRAYSHGQFDRARPIADSQPEWILRTLKEKKVHDEDYIIFSYFNDPAAIIIDAGANYGYSATSMWASGALCKVFSIEPIQEFSKCLEALKTARPAYYDFVIGGLGQNDSELVFTVPVVDGRMLGALTSSDQEQNLTWLKSGIFQHVVAHRNEKAGKVSFYRFKSPVFEFDNLYKQHAFLNASSICAIKIDTEGCELQIIRGMKQTIARFCPLMLIENGSKSEITAELGNLGYLVAQRAGNKLFLPSSPERTINRFFVHQSKLDEYVEAGMLTGTVPVSADQHA